MVKQSKKKNKNLKKTKKQNNNYILQEYYEWEGQQLWNKLNNKKNDVNRIFNYITKKYNNDNQEVELVKTDTGIIVIVLKNIVIKIYTKQKYEKIKEIINYDHPNIEKKIKNIKLKNMYFVVSEKIIPILVDLKINPLLNQDKIKNDKKKIQTQINNVLDKIDELGFVHGDTRLDNIGVEIKNDKYNYILFDFGATESKKESLRDLIYDKNDLIKSIKLFL